MSSVGPTTEEIDAQIAEDARLDTLPQIAVGEGAAILVEAPTGICFVYAPEFNDGPSLRREGFLLPIKVDRMEVAPTSVYEALKRVSYSTFETDSESFWSPTGHNPSSERRTLDPMERVRCIPVRTVVGQGWLVGDELWNSLGA